MSPVPRYVPSSGPLPPIKPGSTQYHEPGSGSPFPDNHGPIAIPIAVSVASVYFILGVLTIFALNGPGGRFNPGLPDWYTNSPRRLAHRYLLIFWYPAILLFWPFMLVSIGLAKYWRYLNQAQQPGNATTETGTQNGTRNGTRNGTQDGLQNSVHSGVQTQNGSEGHVTTTNNHINHGHHDGQELADLPKPPRYNALATQDFERNSAHSSRHASSGSSSSSSTPQQ
jgi:hypothetical protein